MKNSRTFLFFILLLLPAVLNCGQSHADRFVDNLFNGSTIDGIAIAENDGLGGISIKSNSEQKVVDFNIALHGTDKINAKINSKIYAESDSSKQNLIREFDITSTQDKGSNYTYKWDGKDSNGELVSSGNYVAVIDIKGKKTNGQPSEINREKVFTIDL